MTGQIAMSTFAKLFGLLLAVSVAAHASPLLLEGVSPSSGEYVEFQSTFFGMNVAGNSCGVLPFTDNFTYGGGTGPVNPTCWTQSTAAGYVSLIQSSGTAKATGSGTAGAVVTGLTFSPSLTSAQGVLNWSGGNYMGVCLWNTGGNGNCYVPQLAAVFLFTSGSGTGSSVSSCAAPTTGHTVKLSYDYGTSIYTVTDVTASSTVCSGSASAPPAGSAPGIYISGPDSVGSFVGH